MSSKSPPPPFISTNHRFFGSRLFGSSATGVLFCRIDSAIRQNGLFHHPVKRASSRRRVTPPTSRPRNSLRLTSGTHFGDSQLWYEVIDPANYSKWEV